MVVASSYWNASALAYHAGGRSLPQVYSPHRGYGMFEVPPGQVPALLVGEVRDVERW